MLSQLLAFCRQDELARLENTLTQQQLTLVAVTEIEQGLSNHSVKLTTLNNQDVQCDYLLRINSPVTDVICNRDNEIACWRAAEGAGLAPKLYWIDENKRFYLAEWIDEDCAAYSQLQPWQQFASNGERVSSDEIAALTKRANNSAVSLAAVEPTEQAAVDMLLDLLFGLRQLPAPALDISIELQWHIYLARLEQMATEQNFVQADAAEWLARLRTLQQFKVQPIFDALNRVLLQHQYCHRDLSATNLLLRDKQLFCIDFEYCCSSHPLFELAGVVATHRFSPVARQQLMWRYLEQHPCVTADAIRAMPAAFDIFWLYSCAWALQMADGQCKDGRELFAWFDNYLQLVGK
ncbi:hypothetical protein HR45_04875 [Shewanella mangrovi]|uniref:Aminoglycoside phosphotransferase domain-containing protein n=1 Tax=Shewanella mangrovi TaxID=1515746 RepID=A0A094K246_9GAMM|nr:phosphotransferase [Shewanella mangrovi]KFZ38751.1 hypothetical protein HR45_04875 [Shewanella mangrovi]